ncbi:helix-turn-helix transcriptional regulator [Aliiroseovarius sp. Z3]|uniref:ArsR/SmtB family transcription factor n=1 Tax=Aliiroseovarius sp. Z3 TaxID=2811402 RepID=UPI0023B31AD8|nr:metalloregulator ArsR/SmtB family transcription factor [Aliiroseovarius sp. Z3]MDE9449795.1 helix-turn-helix transcriptional regulator [Aliiroseovarius sp. Z3]
MVASHDTVFRSLADPTRRAIFERLCLGGEQNVLALTEQAGISQPAVSKHLAILKKAGLVSGRQKGRETRYAANTKALAPLVDWTRTMSRFWDTKLDGLEDILTRMDQ